MRMPGIISLHACTATIAIHYAYRHTFNDETRRILLLQMASFLSMFRERGRGEGRHADRPVRHASSRPGSFDYSDFDAWVEVCRA